MGNPFVHIDLSTGDRQASKKFYKSVFDWKLQDFPEMSWTGIDPKPFDGPGCGGGIGDKQMPEAPTAWTAYVGVASVKKTLAKAQKAGAKVILPYLEVGQMGALAVFMDPQGATLGIWEQRAQPPAAKKTAAKKKAAPKKAAAKTAKKTAKKK